MTFRSRQTSIATVFLAALACPASSGAGDATGTITGVIEPPGRATAVSAVDRSNDKKYPGAFDPASGKFTITGLPTGAAFDCVVDFEGGARLEGVNMKVPRSEYEEEQPLSAGDVEAIKGKVRDLNKFEDEVTVLAVEGNIQHAAVVVNKLRTRPFVNSRPGEIVWRCELWKFERPEETWVKVQDELLLVLYRERIPRSAYGKKSVTFDPALGGLAVGGDAVTVNVGPVKPPDEAHGIRFRTTQRTEKP